MNVPRALPRLSPDEEAELDASMSRHPAGKRQNALQCPTCGNRPSGALGDTNWTPELVR